MSDSTHKAAIKLLIMDVDGTLTDGKIYISGKGEEFKAFNVKDGYGISELLNSRGVLTAVITGRTSEIVEYRCKELGIPYVRQGVRDKYAQVCELMAKLDLSAENIAYIGDDDNDIEAMNAAGLAGCPADASERVIKIADFVAAKKGGDGAVREFIEWMLRKGCIGG